MIVLRKKPSCPYSFYRKGVIITRKVIFNWMCEGKELKLLDSNGEDVTIETMKKINKVYLRELLLVKCWSEVESLRIIALQPVSST